MFQSKMKNYPYTTQWKDGKPNQAQNTKDKGTLDPLQRNSINMSDYVPFCIICQSPHSLDYCTIAQSFATNQNVQNEEGEEENDHDDVSYNVVNLCDDYDDYDLEELECDVADQRNFYQLHHQSLVAITDPYKLPQLDELPPLIHQLVEPEPQREM